MKDKIKSILSSRVFVFLIGIPSLAWVYAPIVAGIFFWMALWMVPAVSSSWIFFSMFGSYSWLNRWLVLKYVSNKIGVYILLGFEIMLVIIGSILFLWGIIYIAKVKINKEGLAIGGPYKYIRHPQHLGFILIGLSFSLYIPGTEDSGIRIGEILSWSLFSLFLILWCDFEDWKLAKEFGENFKVYYSTTNAFFPKVFQKNKQGKNFDEIKYWKRYLLIFLVYLSFVSLVYLLSYILNLYGYLQFV